ncbi:MAG: type II toxin-antitoxin system VapC family toxin [Candidatus Nanohaloarchaea archaeon]
MRIVLDSSVVVKWFKQEEDSNKALKIRESYFKGDLEIAIPDLVFYEISNVMKYDDEFDVNQIKDSMESLRDMDFEVVAPYTDLLDKAIELAEQNSITIYDASFLALAELLDARLVTTDQELYRKTEELGNTKKLESYVEELDTEEESQEDE